MILTNLTLLFHVLCGFSSRCCGQLLLQIFHALFLCLLPSSEYYTLVYFSAYIINNDLVIEGYGKAEGVSVFHTCKFIRIGNSHYVHTWRKCKHCLLLSGRVWDLTRANTVMATTATSTTAAAADVQVVDFQYLLIRILIWIFLIHFCGCWLGCGYSVPSSRE